MKVPSSDTGTEIAGMMVARPLRRKANTTITTSAIEIASARSTSRSDARMVVVRSITTSMSIASGIVARSLGSRSFTRSTVSRMLAPGCR